METIKRTKESQAEILDNGNIFIRARLSDNFHEMEMEVEFSFPELKVITADARMIRFPHTECPRGLNNLSRTVNVKVEKGLTQKMEALIGGWGGCVHITNLFMECAQIAVAARYQRMRELVSGMFPGLTDVELLKVAIETGADIVNSCERYADYSEVIMEAKECEPSDAYKQLKEMFEVMTRQQG